MSEISWNPGQRAGIDGILAWYRDPKAGRFLSLTGPAGTGKTSVLKEIARRLAGHRVAWAGMTGKAAGRVREVLGVAARTLHALLYLQPTEIDLPNEQRIELQFEHLKGGRASLLVLDEASMCGPSVKIDLERSAYSKILLVGDPVQLPPVLSRREESEYGEDYSIFAGIPGPRLTEVMRTSGAIVLAATEIREQHRFCTDSFTEGGSTYEFRHCGSQDEALGEAAMAYLDDPDDHVVLVWKNETRMIFNHVIRESLGITDSLPQPGEKVVIRKNIYNTGISNGDSVEIVEWLDVVPDIAGIESRWVIVRCAGGAQKTILLCTSKFDGTIPYVGLDTWRAAVEERGVGEPVPATYGYAQTAHMAQGSEFRRVTTLILGDMSSRNFRKQTVLPDGNSMGFGMRHSYTCLTRGKKHASLIVAD